ncbi:hypothetical protein CLOM_g9663 [Closterium sp. NIES-68]|nr:hypothetical protein CLOM_g9663 [Closterium sp. NIES-68]GJP58507.1 hypothetical protein CLOP_g365 [Closterium sp. NIES-67]GJP84457.1 hypothetical protein CLOP_g14510 [Closterium sp. NIES-67]
MICSSSTNHPSTTPPPIPAVQRRRMPARMAQAAMAQGQRLRSGCADGRQQAPGSPPCGAQTTPSQQGGLLSCSAPITELQA